MTGEMPAGQRDALLPLPGNRRAIEVITEGGHPPVRSSGAHAFDLLAMVRLSHASVDVREDSHP